MGYKNIYSWIIVLIIILTSILWYVNKRITKSYMTPSINQKSAINYIPIGDSYTIGFGVPEEERWPNILTKNLRKKGIDITFIENPAVTGYTVRDAIEFELPIIERMRPNFVTVFIGANDSFGYGDVEIFRKEFRELLDRLQTLILNPKYIVLITLPDYTKAPALEGYNAVELLKDIEKYNKVITEEGNRRGFPIADIFPISQTMTSDENYVLDGLHPSSSGYIKWEKVIFPVVLNVLKK